MFFVQDRINYELFTPQEIDKSAKKKEIYKRNINYVKHNN